MGQKAKRPSDVFRNRVQEVRKRRGWSQQDLADQLSKLGMPIDRATVARTEGGDRGISLDDALLYAAALGASPVNMFVPLASDDPVELAPELVARARHVRRWVQGRGALREEDRRTYFTEASDEEWTTRTDVSLALFLSKAQDMIDAASEGDREREADLIEELNDVLKHLSRRTSRDQKGE